MNTRLLHVEQCDLQIQRQILLLQLITMLWMCIEASVSLFAAMRAHSVALLGFGADSAIELASAFVVFLRFKGASRVFVSEKRAAQITGLLLVALAVFILGSSILAFANPRFRPEPSCLGIGLLVAAAIVMPWPSIQKKALATKSISGALKADAVQSSMCAYLAWIALGGLVLNATFRFSWADPMAALLLLPIVVRESWEVMQEKRCVCAC